MKKETKFHEVSFFKSHSGPIEGPTGERGISILTNFEFNIFFVLSMLFITGYVVLNRIEISRALQYEVYNVLSLFAI